MDSKKIKGRVLSKSLYANLSIKALEWALTRNPNLFIHHSAQGVQHYDQEHVKILKEANILISMSELQKRKRVNKMEEVMLNEKKPPQLRLLVTDKCIFSCRWCHRGGEGGGLEYKKASYELTNEQIKNLVLVLVEKGINYIKISGGEPLIRNDLIKIIKEIKLIKGVKIVELVTSSSMLKECSDSLCDAGLDGLTVSIDTLDKEKIRKYKHNNQEDYLERLIDGIRSIRKKGMPVKINTIPQRNFNEDEIIKIVEFAGENGLFLKFIDLMTMNVNWWMERYIPLSEVEKILQPIINEQIWPTFQPGGTGTPMKCYLLKNGVKLFMRDATVGTHYGRICETCINFPCQDGLMALRLTCDGKLKYCLYRNDNLVDLLSLVERNTNEAKKVIEEAINLFRYSHFKKAWTPEIEREKISQKRVSLWK